jgi:serine/threonine protein kinase
MLWIMADVRNLAGAHRMAHRAYNLDSITIMATQQINHPLPSGFRLEGYRIERQLSLGGFSIVYLAYDEDGVPVVIKEYLPNSLALRAEGQATPVITDDHLAAFRHGMKCFFEEGRALALLNHPNVVRVLNFFRANETVYMVMQYENGCTLQEYIQKHRGEIREAFVRNVFTRLLNGLRVVHAQKLLHLDIKPSNIYLRSDGSPVLLDFGAARQALHNDEQALKPMYTPGFAAPEQYNKTGKTAEKMGPWTDIYAVGASMYACLACAAPQAADQRRGNDLLQSAERRWSSKYSRQLLQVIDWCMMLDPRDRPASVFALQKVLVERHYVIDNPSWRENLGQSLKTFFRK